MTSVIAALRAVDDMTGDQVLEFAESLYSLQPGAAITIALQISALIEANRYEEMER